MEWRIYRKSEAAHLIFVYLPFLSFVIRGNDFYQHDVQLNRVLNWIDKYSGKKDEKENKIIAT